MVILSVLLLTIQRGVRIVIVLQASRPHHDDNRVLLRFIVSSCLFFLQLHPFSFSVLMSIYRN